MKFVAFLALVVSACSTPDAPAPAPVLAVAPPTAPATDAAPEAAAPAHADHINGDHHDGDQRDGDADEEAEAPLPPTVIPATYAATIAALREQQSAVKALLDSGALKAVHPIAKQIMDLATALPGKSASLPAEVRGKVTLKALDLREQGDALHDKADDGDSAGAKAAFATASADIDALAGWGARTP